MTQQTFEGTDNQTPSETQPDETGIKTNAGEGSGFNPDQWETEKQSLIKEKEDWQKKFSDSARGAQALLDEKKLLEAKLDEMSSKSLSDDEFSKHIPNWDYMTEGEKEANKRAMVLEKQLASHSTILNQLAEEKAWEADFGKTIKSNPELKDYQDEFKDYAYQNIDVKNLDILAKAFLSDKRPSEPAKPKLGLEKPSSGTKTVRENNSYSQEELTELRTKDPDRYRELIKSGKIK